MPGYHELCNGHDKDPGKHELRGFGLYSCVQQYLNPDSKSQHELRFPAFSQLESETEVHFQRRNAVDAKSRANFSASRPILEIE